MREGVVKERFHVKCKVCEIEMTTGCGVNVHVYVYVVDVIGRRKRITRDFA